MTAEIKNLLYRVQELSGYRKRIKESLKEAEQDLEKATVRLQAAEEAQLFLMQVAQDTQENLNTHLSDLVSSALEAVLPDPYRFVIRYVQRRNTTECDLLLVDAEGHEMELLDTVGGGVVDIASLALRVAVHGLSGTDPILILDEPFRNLHKSLHGKAGAMLQELSRKLKIQIIMVSHNAEIVNGADRLFIVDGGRVTTN